MIRKAKPPHGSPAVPRHGRLSEGARRTAAGPFVKNLSGGAALCKMREKSLYNVIFRGADHVEYSNKIREIRNTGALAFAVYWVRKARERHELHILTQRHESLWKRHCH